MTENKSNPGVLYGILGLLVVILMVMKLEPIMSG